MDNHQAMIQDAFSGLRSFMGRWSAVFSAAVTVLAVMITLSAHAHAEDAFRVGFSSAMFTDVNENDAKAAIKVWGEMIVREQNIPVETTPHFFQDFGSLENALHQSRLDVVALDTVEYSRLLPRNELGPVFLTSHAGSVAEHYVLLVHRDGPVKKLADLRGQRLRGYNNPRACLAPLWLDVVLIQNELGPAMRLARSIAVDSKLANVVLPVFFRQAEAALVTRSGFALMSELNPQVGQNLVVLAESEAMVPAVFAFRANFTSPHRAKILAGVRDLNNTPAGQQVLTIFNSESIAEHPAASLDSALDLVAKHKRLVQ